MKLETVRINRSDGPRGFRVINAADFDPSKHSRYSESGSATPKTTVKSEPKKRRGRPRKSTNGGE